MERNLVIRLDAFKNVLKTLHEAVDLYQQNRNLPHFRTYRDSLIQRFEYSMDLCWKLVKIYLESEKDVIFTEIGPRISFREAMSRGLLQKSELEILSSALEDRNMTVNTYREDLAVDIAERIPAYANVFQEIVKRMSGITT